VINGAISSLAMFLTKQSPAMIWLT
jgi:hypothetical protein